METIIIPMLIIGAIGGALGLILSVASKAFYVYEDPRYAAVTELLPGYNCGGCGFPGCSGLATALVDGKTDDVKRCKPSTQEQRDNIKAYLANTPDENGNTIQVKG